MFGHVSFRILVFAALALVVTACGAPVPSDEASVLDQVNIYLSQGDCPDALNVILPFYNSVNTDNDVRMAMAEVYACEAGFNFFGFLNTATGVSFSSPGVLYELFAEEFPSSGTNVGDKVVESAGFGIDALMASFQSGIVLVPGDLFNISTNNPGSLLYTDRTEASNQYLLFLTMGAMGGLENRVGASATGKPTNSPPLPWINANTNGMTSAAGLNASGCEYASAMLNFADVIAQLTATCPSNPSKSNIPCVLAETLNAAAALGDPNPVFAGLHATAGAETFSQAIYDACNYGCTNAQPGGNDTLLFNPLGGWQKSGCTVSGLPSCDQCPILLRNRGNCAGTTTDETSCAAAGIINFVNNSAIGWQ